MSNPAPNMLTVGQKLPDFTLKNAQDQPMTLADVRGRNGTVIAFIHGSFCPYCMPQLQRLNTIIPQLTTKGINLVCISQDAVSTILGFQLSTEPTLQYTLLAHNDPTVAQAYGVDDEAHGTPYPALFLANADDTILYSAMSLDPVCNPDRTPMMAIVEGIT